MVEEDKLQGAVVARLLDEAADEALVAEGVLGGQGLAEEVQELALKKRIEENITNEWKSILGICSLISGVIEF